MFRNYQQKTSGWIIYAGLGNKMKR